MSGESLHTGRRYVSGVSLKRHLSVSSAWLERGYRVLEHGPVDDVG
jgi:hypothetical protein